MELAKREAEKEKKKEGLEWDAMTDMERKMAWRELSRLNKKQRMGYTKSRLFAGCV